MLPNNCQHGGKKTKKSKSSKKTNSNLTEEQRIEFARAAAAKYSKTLGLSSDGTTTMESTPTGRGNSGSGTDIGGSLVNEIKNIGRGYHDGHYKFDTESKQLAEQLVKNIQQRENNAALYKKKKRTPHMVLKTKKATNASKGKSKKQSGGSNNSNNASDDVRIAELGQPNLLRKSIDASGRQLQWGLGVEHEMQIFHAGKTNAGVEGFDNANIIFDSQESTCFITGDKHKQGSCCKLTPGGACYYHPATTKLKNMVFRPSDKLGKEEFEFLSSLDWELTGRRATGCKPNSVIVPRVPVLMPELVTSNFRNRTINSIAEETQTQESVYLNAQMKNPFTREKVRLYGELVTHVCASLDNIKVPRRPTIFQPEYNLENGAWSDYVGSYHVTLTLPHPQDISTKEFVELHTNCANAIQWLEPLLITAFFGPDMAAVGSGPIPGIEGSFRVMAVGWGNLAGSDVREFGKSGIGRGANHETRWREGFKLKGTQRIRDCVYTAPPQYKKAVDILTSDFRTFNFERNMQKCQRESTPYDCPKVDGGLMEPPFGMEIRIFDHFPSEYVLDLLKIIVRVAANAVRHPPTGYVYNNKAWKECVQGVMREGWNYHVKTAYLDELRKHLGLKLTSSSVSGLNMAGDNSTHARDILIRVMAEMHKLVSNSALVGILDETPDVGPRIPDFNRMCWAMSFRQKGYQRILVGKLRRVLGKRARKLTLAEFANAAFKREDKYPHVNSILNRKRFGHQIEDMVYALESSKHISIEHSNTGKITSIKLAKQ